MMQSHVFRRYLILITLMTAGEVVFLLPFVLSRIFRPTFLQVFAISNLELGTAFSLYGIVAMGSYFLGGPLADRYPARRLMSLALLATGMGGIMLSLTPNLATLTILYAFWGLTTILLFWSALIRATRVWGGESHQGSAYGLLDGGRGLIAAILASISVFVFSLLLPENADLASPEELANAFRKIIYLFTFITFLAGLLVWSVLPEESAGKLATTVRSSFKGIRGALQSRAVWLQAIIIVCAYVGYKCTDDFSLYASDAFGYNDVEAARIGTLTFWVRPLAALSAGFLSDRIRASSTVAIAFLVMILGSSVIAMGWVPPGDLRILLITAATTSLGIYALRGVYFALMQEAHVPTQFTGSAVGLMSVVGFTPDVFMGPLMGYLIDRSPGATGHEHLFGVLVGVGVVGFLATVAFIRSTRIRL